MNTNAIPQRDASELHHGILDQIIAHTRLEPCDDAYGIAKRGVAAFIEELLKPRNNNEPVKKALADTICDALEIHAALEEEIFYPVMRQRDAGELECP